MCPRIGTAACAGIGWAGVGPSGWRCWSCLAWLSHGGVPTWEPGHRQSVCEWTQQDAWGGAQDSAAAELTLPTLRDLAQEGAAGKPSDLNSAAPREGGTDGR